MKIIIPMAGRGSRLRPHTLTVPKPLVPVAGKPIVQRLIEDLTASYGEPVEEIAFIIGDFGQEAEDNLMAIAKQLNTKGSIYHQTEPLGTAHAILCAADSLSGNCIVAFADTLFKADFNFDPNQDGIIWTQKVADPSAYGVVKLNDKGVITEFIEKSPVFVSDLAIVGIYYFKDGENLKKELQYLLDNNIKDKGEFQLTNALENMKQKGLQFIPGVIDEWLDCGNKNALVHANERILELKSDENMVSDSVKTENAIIIQPCYIGENVVLKNSVIGPHVSIGDNSLIENCVINKTIIQHETKVSNAILENSMLGSKSTYTGQKADISLGDFSEFA